MEEIMHSMGYRRNRDWFVAEKNDEKLINALSKGPEEVLKVLKRGIRIEARDYCDRTALMCAVKKGYIEVVKVLLQRGADVNGKMYEGTNVMHTACAAGHEEIARLLVAQGAKIDEVDEYLNTMLQVAVQGENEKVVELLLDNGSNLEKTNRQGMTALHFAARAKNGKIISLLLNRGANIEARCKNGKTPIFYAFEVGKEDNVKLLLQRGARLDDRDANGDTCLKYAVEGKNESLVNLLLDAGLNINEASEFRSNPLYIAVEKGSESMIQLLLDRGAVFTEYISDSSVFKCVPFSSMLHYACLRGLEDIVKQFLKQGANIQVRDQSDKTPLLIAAEMGNVNLIELLLSHGANINEKNSQLLGHTALYLATKGNHEDAIKLLLKRDANINFFYERDQSWSEYFFRRRLGCSESVLHVAAENGNGTIVKILLDHDMDANFRAGDNVTALHVACVQGHPKIVKLLLERGADINERTQDGKSLIESAGTDFAKVIVQHVVKLLSRNQFVCDDVLNFIQNNASCSGHQEKCQMEIDKMKCEKIRNSTILYYDLLISENPSQLAAFASNEDALQVFKSNTCKETFPMYESTLSYQMKKGLWRKLLLSNVRNFFHAVANVEENRGLAKLPAICVFEIFSFLHNQDLRTLMRVCNCTSNVQISDLEIE